MICPKDSKLQAPPQINVVRIQKASIKYHIKTKKHDGKEQSFSARQGNFRQREQDAANPPSLSFSHNAEKIEIGEEVSPLSQSQEVNL